MFKKRKSLFHSADFRKELFLFFHVSGKSFLLRRFSFLQCFQLSFPLFIFPLFCFSTEKKGGIRGKKEVLNQKKAKQGEPFLLSVFIFRERAVKTNRKVIVKRGHFQQLRSTISNHAWKGERRMKFPLVQLFLTCCYVDPHRGDQTDLTGIPHKEKKSLTCLGSWTDCRKELKVKKTACASQHCFMKNGPCCALSESREWVW